MIIDNIILNNVFCLFGIFFIVSQLQRVCEIIYYYLKHKELPKDKRDYEISTLKENTIILKEDLEKQKNENEKIINLIMEKI